MNAAQSGGHHTGGGISKKSSQMEELVAISPERRNWRGIFIALLVIAAVFSLIIFSIILLSPEDEAMRIRGRRMLLSDILGNNLLWKNFNGSWINGVELIFRDTTGGLSILNFSNYTLQSLMPNSTFRQLNAESFSISSDQKYVLLQSDTNVKGSRYHVYEVLSTNTFPLGPSEKSSEAPYLQFVMWAPYNALPLETSLPKANVRAPITTTSISPKTSSLLLSSLKHINESKTTMPNESENYSNKFLFNQQAIAFVYNNDIYYKPKVQGEPVYRITTTGIDGVVYNGIPDWTYSNVPELDNSHSSIVFSPTGQYMAFLTFNDSEVNEYKYTWMADNVKYPSVLTQRYAQAGSTNPNVKINVVSLAVLNPIKTMRVVLPLELSNDSYVGGLTWASASDLSLTITNRAQSKASTVLCRQNMRLNEFHCHILHTEVNLNDGWVVPAEKPIYSARLQRQLPNNDINNDDLRNETNGHSTYEISNGRYLLKRLPVRDGEHGFYRHVVFISSLDRRAVPLTMGQFEVTELVGWDERNEIVYFMAAPEKRPGERHLYKISVKLNYTKSNRTYITSSQPTCLTCDNTPETYKLKIMKSPHTEHENEVSSDTMSVNTSSKETEEDKWHIPNNCLFNKIYFSLDFSHYVQECLGPDSPSIYLVETKTNMKIFVLDAGDILKHRLSQLALPQIRIFSVEIRHGFHAQVRLFLPPGMREEEEVAFPLVLNVDSSPGSQLVNHQYKVDWNWYLCSQRSMIVAQIDGRGSGFQGEMIRRQVHGKLGTVEIEDQLGVLTYLRDNLKFIDPSRICAYGWGYGGYATAMMLIEDSQHVLQCGVAINSIVSFRHHYSFFTERYIPFNKNYLHALQEADLATKAGNLNGRNIMLIHGTADTLVHQDHTLNLVRSLVNQEVKFRHQVYPDEDHFLSKSLNHVYKTLEWYFDESFGPAEDTEWDPTGLFVFKQ